MRSATYEDEKGRKWLVKIPETAPDSDASMGIVVGPPSLDSLGLPEHIAIKLHNGLFDRDLFTEQDVKQRKQEVIAALLHAIGADVRRVMNLYSEVKYE